MPSRHAVHAPNIDICNHFRSLVVVESEDPRRTGLSPRTGCGRAVLEGVDCPVEVVVECPNPEEMAARSAVEGLSPVGGLPEARLRRVMEHIRSNLHRQLRLAELSALVCMSPYHFSRMFKRSTGMSPHRFVVRRRIDEGTRLLAAQELAIGAIARAVGFRTPSHFTTAFRRTTGLTPSAYRTVRGAP